jgi:endonuclease-3
VDCKARNVKGAISEEIDTHIFRVTRRLGWIPEKASVEQAHDLLAALVPPRLYYRLHLNLIEHGRAICHALKPECERCPLRQHCEYFRTVLKPNPSAS